MGNLSHGTISPDKTFQCIAIFEVYTAEMLSVMCRNRPPYSEVFAGRKQLWLGAPVAGDFELLVGTVKNIIIA